MSLVNFIQGECELTSGDASDVPTEAMLASLMTCCNNNADNLSIPDGLGGCCSRGLSHGGLNEQMLEKCGAGGGGGASCPQDLNYPTVSSPFGPFRCCDGDEGVQACSGDANGDSLCAAYELASRPDAQCQYDEVNTRPAGQPPNMKRIKVCPKDVPPGFQNLPSCTGTPPPSIRNSCKSDKDCDTGYSCHRKRCKKSHGGHKRKKDQPAPAPSPSPGPSPVTGQGNKGGMSGGEIAGIVVGSVAGAILLLLAVGALLRSSGKKGKKK